ncbi:hypothetical protein [Flavobacterium sp. HNIBRBA15423]|uniref:hypothetical protein n=1 Tax=Flavobacterium sp. HNIBRBA15423 TaxID=3458683 RepID=UPI004043B702
MINVLSATSLLGGSTFTNASTAGANIVDTANGTASLDVNTILTALDGFGINVVSGFSNLFANGMDFSCWNSSYNPQEAQKDITADIPFALKWSGFEDNPNNETIKNLMKFIYSYRSDAQNGQKLVKCSAKGHKMREEAISAFEDQIMGLVRNNFTVTTLRYENGELYIASGVPYRRGQPYRWKYENMPVYDIKPIPKSGGANTNAGNANVGATAGNTGVTGGVETTNTNPTSAVVVVGDTEIPIKVDPKDSKPSGGSWGWLALLFLI